ncbi:unnamed protein product, partial [Symbiodinium microadriaticum]
MLRDAILRWPHPSHLQESQACKDKNGRDDDDDWDDGDPPQKKQEDQSQAEEPASEAESEGPFVEWPPEKPIGPFLEVGLDVMVEWPNLDNVWKACKESDREFYKNLKYEELLQMMEVALGPRPTHVLTPVEVPDDVGEERHPGLGGQLPKKAAGTVRGRGEDEDDEEQEEEECEDEEEEEQEDSTEPNPKPKLNDWNGTPSPATKENPRPATKENALTESPKALQTNLSYVKPTDLSAKFNHVQRSNSERSLTTLVLGADQANDQAYQHRPPSVVAGGAKGEASYEGCHACTAEFVLRTFAACRCQLISRHDAMCNLRLVSASQAGTDSDLRSLVTSMQSEITRLKALLDAKPPAATASAEPEPEQEEEEEEDDEDDVQENDDEQEAQEDEEEETPPPKGTKPSAEVSVAKGPKPKGPNSSTHRAEWMKFGRRMESQGSEFPEMTKMWNGTKEEQHAVFAKWLEKEMNMGNTEAQLIITKSKSAEVKSGYEELTVAEMVKRGFSATKIENIVRKGGTPDPDAPHCLESIIYLCRKKKDVDESEKISQTGEVRAKIAPNAKAVAPLMQLNGMPAPSISSATSGHTDAVLQYAANAFASSIESALRDATAHPKKAPKSKAKAKAKAQIQVPKTIKEQLEDCRKELKKEYNAANICYDLPKDHSLRVEMEKHKADLENQMDTLKEVDDDGAEDFLEVRRLLSYEMNWLAKTIGRGYASVKHAAEIGGALDRAESKDFMGELQSRGCLWIARLLQCPVVVILICWWLTGIWFPATGNVFFASTPVIRLHFFVAGFRGDWKALRQAFNFNRYADRDKATRRLKLYAKTNKLNLRLKKLTKTKLNWSTTKKSSGFDTYIVQQWVLHEISSVRDPGLDGNLVLALWASNHCISLWSNAGRRWLTSGEVPAAAPLPTIIDHI